MVYADALSCDPAGSYKSLLRANREPGPPLLPGVHRSGRLHLIGEEAGSSAMFPHLS